MKYLLDSDVIINHLRSKKTLSPEIFVDGVGASVITQGELLYGAYKSASKKKNEQLITGFFEDFSLEILPLNSDIIYSYVKLRVELENNGTPLDQFDLLIASTALIYSLILVTNNNKHFERIPGLQIYSE